MEKRKTFNVVVAREGAFSEVGVERFRSEQDLAKDHVIGRNRRVGELLCYLSLMRSHGLIPQDAEVSCIKARYQDYSSKSSDGNEAAHYLPGQIIIKFAGNAGFDPSHYVKDSDTESAIGSLFSRVQDLPADYNKADSYVEKYTRPGLKQLLAEACRKVINHHIQLGASVNPIVRIAFNKWIEDSLKAYAAAINRKTDIAGLNENPIPPGTEPALLGHGTTKDLVLEPHIYRPERAVFYERAVRKNRAGETTATIWDYSQQIRIIEYYVRHTVGSELPAAIVKSIESTFRP
jgi:hypothetical protein